MKPNLTFQRLLIGALALTHVRSLEGAVATTFSAELAECNCLEDVISLIATLPDLRSGPRPSRVTASELLMQGDRITVNLKSTGSGCELRIRLRAVAQTQTADAECRLEFDNNAKPNAYHSGTALAAFVAAANKKGRALDAEAVLYWLSEFGARPESKAPSPTSRLSGVTA